MRRIAALVLLVLAACVSPMAPKPTLDALAERYVRLTLEIDTHDNGYVDSFYGPPEWKTEAAAHPRSVADLKTEADALANAFDAAATRARDPLIRRRAHFLAVNARAARFRLDMIGGAHAPFMEEAQKLFDLRPDLKPLSFYDPVLARIDALVPGPGSLADRVEAFRARYVIPPDRLERVIGAAIDECRARTKAHLALPENEHFSMELVNHQSWGAYNWYHGDNQSVIQINTDLPVFVTSALSLGCHEGYPGHHVQGITAEHLYRAQGWVEYSVQPLYAPRGPLDEGGANFGIELAFPGDQRLAFEQSTLYPLAGLDPATAPAMNTLRLAMQDLAAAGLTIDQQYLDGQITHDQAIALKQHYELMSRERAEHSLAFADHYRAYVINYVSGEDLVRAYVMRGADEAARWRRYQNIWGEPTLPEDLAQ
ncbi:MAG: hypothetical protein ABUL73_00495 [Alphaproteobacteria bacterium]